MKTLLLMFAVIVAPLLFAEVSEAGCGRGGFLRGRVRATVQRFVHRDRAAHSSCGTPEQIAPPQAPPVKK